ncbi:MAG: zinc-ribbon domain-containing protein [Atopobiaceae bacterium]|nr:zinc-ribbon domain-containing protein [Atopobiaceae bacterium]
MFCSYCGAQLPDGAVFCSHCGKPVAAPVPEPVAEVVEEVAAPVVEAVEEIVEPVAEVVEEVAAPVVEAVEEAPEVVETVSADVEDALARLRAEMEAAGELPTSSVAEPVAEPVVEPKVEAPVFEAAAPAVAEVAPVVPVAPAAEPASYVEPTPAPAPAPAAPQPTYTPAPQPAYTPAPQQSYTPAPQPAAQSYTPQQAYTQPTQSYTPPAPTGQPAPSYSYQPAATSVAGAKPAKKSPIAKIAIGVIALALVGFIVFSLFGGGGKKPSGGSSSGGGSSTPVVTPTDGGGSTTPSTPAPSSGYDTVDSKANPTFYTMLETDGENLINVIETEGGFSWKSDNLWWLSPDGNDAFYVMGKDDYEFTRTEIRSLPANGEGTPCVYVLVVDDRDYSSMSDVVDKLCNISLDDSVFVDDEGLGMALVSTPSGATDLVVITYIEDPGLYRVNIFNEDAIAAGVFEDAFDVEGSTATEVWHNIMD